jgi:glycosyltransferase involved in cell wall biosynthesis
MRVALIAPEIPDYSVEYSEIAAKRCDVLLCIADKHSATAHVKPRLETARLAWPRQRELRNLIFMRDLAHRIREWNPDIVHFMNESNVWLSLLIPILGKIPVVTTVHDIQIHPGDTSSARVPRFLTRLLVKLSDAIVVHGGDLRSDAIRHLPVTPKSVFVLPHPPLKSYSEIAKQRKFGKPQDGRFRILFFGRIHKYKGVRYLLEAVASVQANVPNVEVLIAGRGDDLSHDLCKLGQPPFVKVDNRFIPPDEVARLFAEADLLVLPYIEGSQSGVLMVAMAFGLPVVATNVGEIPDVVRSVGMGLVVPSGQTPALATAITQIALDPGLHRRFSEGAVAAMNGEYSDDTLSSRILATYENVLNIAKRS